MSKKKAGELTNDALARRLFGKEAVREIKRELAADAGKKPRPTKPKKK